jgi:hypothetical protein
MGITWVSALDSQSGMLSDEAMKLFEQHSKINWLG